MFERIGFQRFCAEIPGHEVFGVLEADFLPVKAAWIEYERRSVLFQLVMKAMRMAVRKYYYEIQTTYVFPLLSVFSLTHTHIHVTVHILPPTLRKLNQEARTRMCDRYRSFTRQATVVNSHHWEEQQDVTLVRSSIVVFRHRPVTSSPDILSWLQTMMVVWREMRIKNFIERQGQRRCCCGQMASLDRTIQCAVIQHDGSVCLQEANEPYGTWTV